MTDCSVNPAETKKKRKIKQQRSWKRADIRGLRRLQHLEAILLLCCGQVRCTELNSTTTMISRLGHQANDIRPPQEKLGHKNRVKGLTRPVKAQSRDPAHRRLLHDSVTCTPASAAGQLEELVHDSASYTVLSLTCMLSLYCSLTDRGRGPSYQRSIMESVFFCDQALRRGSLSCSFLILHSRGGERTDADVNTARKAAR
ncbi:hypothetical protein JOB18_003809 [Solea senegalensis]|uniref:Uncharacterized protein n=1 Tax=Solea senegalensis TaxID=28829 RepID=A0AAV6Q202_SOLSE|nr:hypothetical protein JOB18_003809 [Solea senegalensis]